MSTYYANELPKNEKVWFEFLRVDNYLDLAVILLKGVEEQKASGDKSEVYKMKARGRFEVVEFRFRESEIKVLAFDQLVEDSPKNREGAIRVLGEIYNEYRNSYPEFQANNIQNRFIKLSLIKSFRNE